jgi:hypothetical protein
MKYLLSFVALCLIGMTTFAQSSTPAASGEFCPKTQITFNVTVPGKEPAVTSWTGSPMLDQAAYDIVTNSTQTSTTFKFKGRFIDVNIAQSFRVTYKEANDTDKEYIMTYKLIKSLYHPTIERCSTVSPSQGTIVWPFCEITTRQISFDKIKWGVFSDSPFTCFGTVNDYEYQLPAGWSIGTSVSTGSNWILGTNNVQVTSDLNGGLGETIKIRAANTCTSGLVSGSNISYVGISRPLAALTLSTGQDYICNVGETTTFSVVNMPPNATVQWTVSDPTMMSIVGSSTSTSVTVSKILNVNALTNLTATVTQCGYVYPPLTRQIALGTGRTTVFFQSHQVVCELPSRPYYYGSVEEFPSANFYEWYLKDNSSASNPFVLQQAMNTNTADFPLRRGNRYYTVRVKAYTPCGMAQSIDMDGVIYAPACTGGARLSANVGADALQVALAEDTEEGNGIREVVLRNLQGQTVFQQVLEGQDREAQFPLSALPSGLYVVSVWDGSTWASTKVIKE